jgi:hypothetical protein
LFSISIAFNSIEIYDAALVNLIISSREDKDLFGVSDQIFIFAP